MTIQLQAVSKSYGLGEARREVLSDIDLAIEQGEFCAILGPSGSGKSTLMNIIGLLDGASRGRVRIGETDATALVPQAAARMRNSTFGFVFQSFELLPRMSVVDNVGLPLLYRGVPRTARRAAALQLLERLGLETKATSRPDQLSGGQRQRVAVARALVGQPRILLADEPTGSLDSASAMRVVELLRYFNRSLGVTVVMITHDLGLAQEMDRQVVLKDGRLVDDVRVQGGGPC